MSTFDQREKAYEAKFAAEQEKQFTDHAHEVRLLGLWAAGKIGLEKAEAEFYALALVRADVHKADRQEVVKRIVSDLAGRGIVVSAAEVQQEMKRLHSKS